jgi:hypothetical protein
MAGSKRQQWPPVFALGIVGVLFFLVLPNPLRIPQNNPAAQAEFAPVPGDRENSGDANFGQVGEAGSDGVGAGGGDGFGGFPDPPPPPDFIYKPSNKKCIGDPPRQTEDPLSPPCVPFFEGDNGGKTWEGVTAEEVLVVYYNDFNVKGDLTKPYRPSDDKPGYPAYYHQNHVKTVKALLRYFQSRYQTYNRRVRLVGYASGGGLGTADSQRVSEMQRIAAMDPFAVVTLIENSQFIAPLAKDHGIPLFGWNEDVPLETYEANRPYMWSFAPDQTTETVWSGEFICRKLRGRPARFTTDPLLLGKPRKFGLIFQNPQHSQRGPFLSQLAERLQAQVKESCNMTFDYVRMFSRQGDEEAGQMMAAMKTRDITTVVCYCIAQQTELHIPKFQAAASGVGYYPEWYWDSTAAMDHALWQQQYGNASHRSFGTSYLWRQGPFNQSHAYRAFQEQEPGQIPNLRFNFEMYHTFLSLFSGLQGAGPILTPESIERGMFTFTWHRRDDPFVPTGGYGHSGACGMPGGCSPYTFIHTGMAWWYDPSGVPPGKTEPNGCIRVVEGGKRYFGPDWPEGDDDLFLTSSPCSEDNRREL